MTVKEYNLTVDQCADRVYRYVLKSVRDADRSRDLVQDSFEKLWRNRNKVDFSKAKSYLFSIAHHTMIDSFRKEKKMTVTDVEEMNIGSLEMVEPDLSEILSEALSKLPEIQRSVILLRDYEGYSYKEIAEVTKLSESAVKVYIYRARLFLKNYLVKIEAVI